MTLTYQSLRHDTRGVAAVEFALLLPVLVALFFGAVELSNLLIADSRLRNAAASVADLITQKSDGVITANSLNIANIAATEIMRPLPVTAGGNPILAILVTNFRSTGPTTANVEWSRIIAGGLANPTTATTLGLSVLPCADTSLPSALASSLNALDVDVVKVTARYRWTPWFAVIYSGSITLTSTNYNMPRYSLQLNVDASLTPGCS